MWDGYIWKSGTDAAPAFPAIDIDEEGSIKCDVLPLHATVRVYQTIGSNDPSARVAEDIKLTIYNLLPDQAGVLAVVNTDRNNTYVG